ncbi:MAG: hypothetical protein R3F49_03825 [Planctomycetota bacterium]
MSSRRGAARVSAVWTIVAFVLLFAALGAFYVASDDAANARRELAAALEAQRSADDANIVEVKKWNDLSDLVGFRGDSTSVPSNLEAMNEALEASKAAFPNMSSVTTFQDALPLMRTAYTTLQGEIAALKQRNADLTSQVQQGGTALADVRREKDGRLTSLESELSDAQANARNEVATLEASVQRLTGERNRLDTDVKTRQSELAALDKSLEESKAQMQSYVRNKTRELNDIRRAAQRPDGEVTAVSTELGRVWINLGAGDRLSEGTVFRVTGADPTDVKGFIEVIEVQPDRAVCRIQSLVNKFAPIVATQRIWNDLYEAKGQRYAVIAGRFDGVWNEKELRVLLDEIGITVQDEIDINTDFLIAGAARPVENDEGEQVMEQVADTTVYKDAISRGLTILSIRDIEQYFRK